MTSTPRLYRNTSTVIQAKLVDNSLQPVRNAPVNYTVGHLMAGLVLTTRMKTDSSRFHLPLTALIRLETSH